MQFDIHRNQGKGADRAPYLLDLQSDRVSALRMRVVAPLIKPEILGSFERLHPQISVLGEPFTLSVSELFAIDRRKLGEVVDSAERYRYRIVAALDLLFTGV